ncbi:ATP synthase F1 subunit delta [Terrilactibacillus sp. S3-3]|nr:ATP synthase F1 subunit delta [Terrilactibacillus sp. S3-3]
MSEIVAKRYAVALFEVAEERGAVDAIESQLTLVVQTLAESEDLRKVLYHPQISADDKKKLVVKVFEKQVGQEVLNLLKLLVDRKRESLIDELREAYIKLANTKRGILDDSHDGGPSR